MSSSEVTLSPLPPDLHPNWEQVRVALTRQGEPDWVPFLEVGISRAHKARVLGVRYGPWPTT